MLGMQTAQSMQYRGDLFEERKIRTSAFDVGYAANAANATGGAVGECFRPYKRDIWHFAYDVRYKANTAAHSQHNRRRWGRRSLLDHIRGRYGLLHVMLDTQPLQLPTKESFRPYKRNVWVSACDVRYTANAAAYNQRSWRSGRAFLTIFRPNKRDIWTSVWDVRYAVNTAACSRLSWGSRKVF